MRLAFKQAGGLCLREGVSGLFIGSLLLPFYPVAFGSKPFVHKCGGLRGMLGAGLWWKGKSNGMGWARVPHIPRSRYGWGGGTVGLVTRCWGGMTPRTGGTSLWPCAIHWPATRASAFLEEGRRHGCAGHRSSGVNMAPTNMMPKKSSKHQCLSCSRSDVRSAFVGLWTSQHVVFNDAVGHFDTLTGRALRYGVGWLSSTHRMGLCCSHSPQG